VDRVVVEKAAWKMALISNGQILKTCRVALGLEAESIKVQEGDCRTPEGLYVQQRRISITDDGRPTLLRNSASGRREERWQVVGDRDAEFERIV